ncbi:MAG: hypothetical protein J5771_05830 [Bacteroidales bacterium]|nr:hypothetical protein [Bacteroidales bacterium]
MKNWYSFLGCLLLAAAIWLIHNLSRMNVDIVSKQIVAESNIEGRAIRASESLTVTARCKASGFRLIYLHSDDKVRVVRFDPEDFQYEGGDNYVIQSAQLYKYVTAIFGPVHSVESFITDKLVCRFTREDCVKVPVKAISNIRFKPQYTLLSELELSPDSVLVYGMPEMLKRISVVYTSNIVKNDVRGDLHGEVALEKPAGVRLSQDEVGYTLRVGRYVEVKASLPVQIRNLPEKVNVSIFPALVDVYLRCKFPLVADDPSEGLECYVDYNEFAGSMTGKCVIHCGALPVGVISCRLEPEMCECVEKLPER